MSGEDRLDAAVRRADPLRSGAPPLDPGLIERIVAAGPAPRRAGRPLVAAVAAATVAVTLGAFAVVRAVGADPPPTPPASAPATSPPAPSPTPCVTTGWRARTVPAGYRAADPAAARQRNWDGEWTRPDGTGGIEFKAYCGTFGAGQWSGTVPNTVVGGHPARRDPGDEAFWLTVQRDGGVILQLSTYGPDQAPEAAVLAIAAALTNDPSVPAPSAPAGACSTALPAWRFVTPAGFRPVSSTRDAGGSRRLTYRRGTAVVSISISCPGAVDFNPDRESVRVPVGRAVYVAEGTQRAVVWQATPQLALLIETTPPGTKADLLAFVAGARSR